MYASRKMAQKLPETVKTLPECIYLQSALPLCRHPLLGLGAIPLTSDGERFLTK
jgi:hypothetical protein